MRVHTHVVFALLCGLVLVPYFGGGFLFLAWAVLGSLLPDIDHPQSFINRKLRITRIFPYFSEHRGVFHSLFAALFILWLGWFFLAQHLAVAVFVGYLSHLFMDSFTKAGVCYLHPLRMFHVHGPFTTGSVGEFLLFLGLVVFVILVAFG